MKKLLSYSLLIFIVISIPQKSFSSTVYPSIYENANYKNTFDPAYSNSYPFMKPEQYYEATAFNIARFKAYFPKGAITLGLVMTFSLDECPNPTSIQYWIGSPTEPTERAKSLSEVWSGGKYMELNSSVKNNVRSARYNIIIDTPTGISSDVSKWVYFKITTPEKCPSYIYILGSYSLNLSKYKTWYDSVTKSVTNTWKSNGDPPDDDTTTTTKTMALSGPNIVYENNDTSITYNVTRSDRPATALNIQYTLSLSGPPPTTIDDYYTCSEDAQQEPDTTCPTQDINGKLSATGTIVIPANSNTGTLKLTFPEDNYDNKEVKKKIVITLKDVDGYTTNGSSFNITIEDKKTEHDYTISVTPAGETEVSQSSGTTPFNVIVSGTIQWSAVVTVTPGSDDWLKIKSGNSGTTSGTIECSYSANNTTSKRTATITITAEGAIGSPQIVTVTQSGTPPVVATKPVVETKPVVKKTIGYTYAQLNGTIKPNDKETYCYFQYRTEKEEYDMTKSTPVNTISSGFIGPNPLSYTLTNLSHNTTYYFKVVGYHKNGNEVYGEELNFITKKIPPPYVTDVQAKKDINSKTAIVVSGKINPKGNETTYYFEYGSDDKYGSKIPSAPKSVGADTKSSKVEETIDGLSPSTKYYFKLSATNDGGTTSKTSKTGTFTTGTFTTTK